MRDLERESARAGELSEIEEEFFRVGASFDTLDATEIGDDLDGSFEAPSLWSRLFGASPRRAATEPAVLPPPPRAPGSQAVSHRASTEGEDEWEWQIAIARARFS